MIMLEAGDEIASVCYNPRNGHFLAITKRGRLYELRYTGGSEYYTVHPL